LGIAEEQEAVAVPFPAVREGVAADIELVNRYSRRGLGVESVEAGRLG